MTADISVVLWKEARSVFRQPGSRLRVFLTVATPIAFFGLMGPWQVGQEWVDAPDPWFIAIAMPLLTVMMTAPDSFAGERERRTLRTLLASRLPDRAILWGKALFAIAAGVGMTVATMLLGIVTANAVDWEGRAALPSIGRVGLLTAVTVLLATLSTGVAMLVSLRAETVQQAQQTLAAFLLLPPTVAGPILLITVQNDDSWARGVIDTVNTPAGVTALFMLLAGVTAGTLALAFARFRRDRVLAM